MNPIIQAIGVIVQRCILHGHGGRVGSVECLGQLVLCLEGAGINLPFLIWPEQRTSLFTVIQALQAYGFRTDYYRMVACILYMHIESGYRACIL